MSALIEDAIAQQSPVTAETVPASERFTVTRPLVKTPFPALLVLAVAVLLWMAYQAYALMGERENLMTAAAQISPQMEAATKVRASIDNIATGVKRLSESGNANARVIVDELARRGVTINPNPSQLPAQDK